MSVQQTIETKLTERLEPLQLTVVNESDMHAGPKDRETHFKVVAVSQVFEGLSAVKRHQQVYAVLQQELEAGVHALALHLYSPEEWQGQAPESPACSGRR